MRNKFGSKTQTNKNQESVCDLRAPGRECELVGLSLQTTGDGRAETRVPLVSRIESDGSWEHSSFGGRGRWPKREDGQRLSARVPQHPEGRSQHRGDWVRRGRLWRSS